MDRREKLDEELRAVMEKVYGYSHTYFQPPKSTRMQYDCIRYKKSTMKVRPANNHSYMIRDAYDVTAICRDADSELPRAIQERFPYCMPGHFYVADDLYHYPFTIHY